MPNQLRATVLIATKNRKEDVLRAIGSAAAQTVPVELIVMDDGSIDGTTEAIRRHFPQARIERSEKSLGVIIQRNRGMELASTPVVFCLDDDAMYSSPRIVEQTLHEFDHPRVGAVAIRHINVGQPSWPWPQCAQGRIYVLYHFAAGACAIRRDVFLKLGGYRPFLLHQGEEPEFGVRMIAAGYVTRAGGADLILHYPSPQRDQARMNICRVRNLFLDAWYHVPMPYLPMRWWAALWNVTRYQCFQARHPLWLLRGLLEAMRAIWHERQQRRPVPVGTWQLIRRLRKYRWLPLEQVEPLLPPLQQPTAADERHEQV